MSFVASFGPVRDTFLVFLPTIGFNSRQAGHTKIHFISLTSLDASFLKDSKKYAMTRKCGALTGQCVHEDINIQRNRYMK
jgi:hypothetical protein